MIMFIDYANNSHTCPFPYCTIILTILSILRTDSSTSPFHFLLLLSTPKNPNPSFPFLPFI